LQDDYINASYIKNISPHSPDFIVTQLPLKTTVLEFLGLIWQEGLETVVSLVPVQDMAEGVYIPQGKESLTVGDFVISLQSVKVSSVRVINGVYIYLVF
jgi:protein tyrosine phosphatase